MIALFLIGEYNEAVYRKYKNLYDVFMCLFVEVQGLEVKHAVLDELNGTPSQIYRTGYMKCLGLTVNQYDTVIVLPFNEQRISEHSENSLLDLTANGVYWPSWVTPAELLTFETCLNPVVYPCR